VHPLGSKAMAERFTADRMSLLGTEMAFEVLAMAKGLEAKGAKLVHFELGEPDFDTPQHIKDACVEALRKGYTHYTPVPGIPELRSAIADWESGELGVDIDPAEVVVMPGAKPCLFSAILATVNPGDEVLIPNPGFPIYESVVRFVGGKPVPVPLREENDFRLSPQDVEERVTPRTKMVVLNSPHNPCGSALSKSDVEGIADIARRRDLLILSDEVYRKLIYEGSHHSPLSEPDMKDRTILVNGFSKTYAMTGWRIGYSVANKAITEHLVKLQVNIASCVAAFTQHAALAALQGPQDCVAQMAGEYDRRRRAIVEGLNKIPGLSCRTPGGAFYVFPSIKKLGRGSREVMEHLLYKGHVTTVHGPAFGEYGEGYIRLSYATSIKNIEEGLRRIKEALQKL